MSSESFSRNTHLDAIRGVAVLGILLMNAISFGLADAAYFNLSVGVQTNTDKIIAALTSVVIDQKMMGLFSLLFGASCALLADRIKRHGESLWRQSFRRYGLLFCFGVLHTVVWEGDILTIYALCAPIILTLRNRSPILLFATGILLMAGSAALAIYCQTQLTQTDTLGSLWYPRPVAELAPGIILFGLADAFLRSIGMMLIGIALYRLGLLAGQWGHYRTVTIVGFVVGLPFSAANAAIQHYTVHSADYALIGRALTTIGTVPLVLAMVAVTILLNRQFDGWIAKRLRVAGQMVLTLYISQTLIGMLVLRVLFERGTFERSWILVFVVAVWAVQLWFSGWWTSRYGQGPLERLLRGQPHRSMKQRRRCICQEISDHNCIFVCHNKER